LESLAFLRRVKLAEETRGRQRWLSVLSRQVDALESVLRIARAHAEELGRPFVVKGLCQAVEDPARGMEHYPAGVCTGAR
jgi:hypothetical protein